MTIKYVFKCYFSTPHLWTGPLTLFHVSMCTQFQFHMWPGGGTGLQSRGRSPDPYDEPAGSVGKPHVQRNAGRGDADMEERGLLRSL